MERYILEALQKAVIAAAIPTSLPVKYLGRTFVPPADNKWIEIVYIPNNIENQYWDESKTYRGILRLVLHWPIDDSGVYSAMDSAQLLCESFYKGAKFQDSGNFVTVMVSEVPNIGGVVEQAPDILIPITIRYTCFKS